MARISSRFVLFGLEGASKETLGEGQHLTVLEEEHVNESKGLGCSIGKSNF